MDNIATPLLGLFLGIVITYFFMKKKRYDKQGLLRKIRAGKKYYFITAYRETGENPRTVIVLCETLLFGGPLMNSVHGRERFYSYTGKISDFIPGTEYVAFSPNEQGLLQAPTLLYTKEELKTLKEKNKK